MQLDFIKMLAPFITDIYDKTIDNFLFGSYYERYAHEHLLPESEQFNRNVLKSKQYKHIHTRALAHGIITKEHYFLNNKAKNVASCGKSHAHEKYEKQGFKDLRSINFCQRRICQLCASRKALSRLLDNKKIVENAMNKYELFHLVLTTLNCTGADLKRVLEKQLKSVANLNRILAGKTKIKGLDFSKYGYAGAIRALEVTYRYALRWVGKEYHPHMHLVFALEKGITLDKTNINKFSYSYKTDNVRYFSDLEVLIQKIWFLLNNDKQVTLANIKQLPLGYSCSIDPIDEKALYEVFKYVVKSYSDDKEMLRYDQFIHLEPALKSKRCIQGYGCFFNIKDDDGINDTDIRLRDEVRKVLSYAGEDSCLETCHIDTVLKDMCSENPDYVYLNMKAIYHIGNEIQDNILAEPDTPARAAKILKALRELRHTSKTKEEKIADTLTTYHKFYISTPFETHEQQTIPGLPTPRGRVPG